MTTKKGLSKLQKYMIAAVAVVVISVSFTLGWMTFGLIANTGPDFSNVDLGVLMECIDIESESQE
ncbi:MAG: hypothetical protein OXN19_16000 [Caldilineaceae bacterium]|nr:hypothetical protein [Caldilineaceae bacterium]